MTAPAAQPDEPWKVRPTEWARGGEVLGRALDVSPELVEAAARELAAMSYPSLRWEDLANSEQGWFRDLALAALAAALPLDRAAYAERIIRRLKSDADFRMHYGSNAVDAVAAIARGTARYETLSDGSWPYEGTTPGG